MDGAPLMQEALQGHHQGGKPLMQLNHPATHRLATQINAFSGVDLFLPVEW